MENELSLINSLSISSSLKDDATILSSTTSSSIVNPKDNQNKPQKNTSIDLNKVDFLGTIDVIKSIFSIESSSTPKTKCNKKSTNSSTNKGDLFVLHKLGNSILIDSIPVNEALFNEFNDFPSSISKSNHKNVHLTSKNDQEKLLSNFNSVENNSYLFSEDFSNTVISSFTIYLLFNLNFFSK